jgi:hypothetical protein
MKLTRKQLRKFISNAINENIDAGFEISPGGNYQPPGILGGDDIKSEKQINKLIGMMINDPQGIYGQDFRNALLIAEPILDDGTGQNAEILKFKIGEEKDRLIMVQANIENLIREKKRKIEYYDPKFDSQDPASIKKEIADLQNEVSFILPIISIFKKLYFGEPITGLF